MIITKIRGELMENNCMIVLLSDVERNMKDMNIESWVLIREGLSGEYEETNVVKIMVF